MLQIESFESITKATSKVTRAGQSMSVNYYYIDGLLIDSGPSRLHKEFISFFTSHQVSQVVFTHHHEDHTGMGAWIQKHTAGIPIYIHNEGINYCQKKARLPLYRRLFWGERAAFTPQEIPSVIKTPEYRFEVIHTPGHARDHIVLFNSENGWLFSGDLFLMTRPKSMFAFESVPTLINSIRNIMSLDFGMLFCAHAGIIKHGKRALGSKLNYLEEMQGRIKHLHELGLSDREIRKRLFPGIHPLHLFSAFENSPAHFVHSITKELKGIK